MDAHMPTLVASAPALRRLVEHVTGLERVGLDTEFHAERRYRPELMLVQLADDTGRTWLVDPKAVDLRPLAEALSGRVWVAFAGDTDVALLMALGGRPAALHDPQRLAGLTGYAWPRSLADLCAAELGVQLDKAPALSDWSRRPLSETQRRYAADDAVMALRLWDALAARADERRLRWAIEEGAEVLEAAARPPDPDARWLRLRVAPRLDEQARAAMHRLSAWREDEARREGQPPWSVLPDAQLLDLARRRPADIEAIRAHRRMHKGKVRKHGAAWLRMIHAEPGPDTPPAPPADRDVRVAALALAAHAIGGELGIAPRLLLPEPWADRVAVHGPGALRGWRMEAVGDRLERLISGSAALALPSWAPGLIQV
jgi:ribonuclease D